ncbi:hypothetical protein QBC47DRAFT_406687 [Echria macrotheca]|uniref:C2H2-type domain-containing protein n=1 Tax=Echria macrotheca TaxID=438768 RepID=A0AAJ0F221_9PEZI|nr:hypothetical protein QBC47DRAFT_406687 [Echria macrotheca]
MQPGRGHQPGHQQPGQQSGQQQPGQQQSGQQQPGHQQPGHQQPGHHHPAYLTQYGSQPHDNAELNPSPPTTSIPGATIPLPDARNHRAQHGIRYENSVPPDASMPTPSPTFPQHSFPGPYVQAPPDVQTQYQHPGSAGLYSQPRPDWAAYSSPGPTMAPPQFIQQAPPQAVQQRNQVYSFVPIPGAQQHKRPRRRYEEIDRMYRCGYGGTCQKAYGTLNHLNAHVTMQGHGLKRTPEEFKEIRKQWKQRKKEENEAKRKSAPADVQTNGGGAPPPAYSRQLPLPPIPAYGTPAYSTASPSGLPADYANSQGYPGYTTSPTSPYNTSMPYGQHNALETDMARMGFPRPPHRESDNEGPQNPANPHNPQNP